MKKLNRRKFLAGSAVLSAGTLLPSPAAAGSVAGGTGAMSPDAGSPETIAPGIWRIRLGTPEGITPVSARHYPMAAEALARLAKVEAPPLAVEGEANARGYRLTLPLAANEGIFGFGLQFHSLLQRGTKKTIRVNADPRSDSGDSHAPVPFYVSTRGYGVLVDTARYATFYCGSQHRKTETQKAPEKNGAAVLDGLPAAYRSTAIGQPGEVLVEIPRASGVDVYLFAGPSLREAVERYNLFSGGGPVPPRWGLGPWYRVKSDYGQQDVLQLAAEFREAKIPCDVLGLEPGWQTHAYSCTYQWSAKFPDARAMVGQLGENHYRLNLWEHAFVNPQTPLYAQMTAQSGDYKVWDGLVPDFLAPAARKTFGDFHEKEHIALGVSGYKLDECDNSDFTRSWSFPEASRFASGADGEQMHSLFGLRYADAIAGVYERRGERTWSLIRSAHALATPYPFVLYSDLYDHKEFVRALVNSGFSGLLWTPEVRDAESTEDLVRRLQTVVLSPVALINAWYIKNPPWKQVEREANNQGRFATDWKDTEAICRRILELRMRLVPYLHAAFVRYQRAGTPPCRALAMDWPADAATWGVDDQFLVGESLLAAPAFAGEIERKVYLPEGDWYDFWSGEKHAGKRWVSVAPSLEQIPLFVKAGSILPLAEPTLHTADPAALRVEARVYGGAVQPFDLYEDDGSGRPSLGVCRLQWDEAAKAGRVMGKGYEVTRWTQI